MDDQIQPQGINVVDTEGNLVSIDPSQSEQAFRAGYRPATEQDISHYQAQQQYGGPTQTLAGLGEAAMRGAIPLGGFTAAERAAGVSPQGIAGRQEALPEGASGAAETLGLIGSSFLPYVGQAGLLEKAGAGTAEALGLGGEGAGILNQIGSGAVKGATEMAILAGGDEAHKALVEDPSAGIENAIQHIGLSSLLGVVGGGAFGAVKPLWNATAGPQIGNMLDSLRLRYNGIDGAPVDAINDAIQKTGMEIAPEVKAALYKDPAISRAFQTLYEGSTGSAQEMRNAVSAFKEGTNQSILDAFEKTPEEISNLGDISNYQVGERIQKQIADKINEYYSPISDIYDVVRNRIKNIPLLQEEKQELINKIAKASIDQGFDKAPSSPQFKMIENAMKEIPEHVNDITDIAKYRNNFKYNYSDPIETQMAKKVIRGALRDSEFSSTERAIGQFAPDVIEAYKGANLQYADLSKIMDGIDSRLNVPNWEGPKTFIRSLMDMQPEKIASRAINKNDAEFLKNLGGYFPEAADTARDYLKSQIFKGAQRGAGDQLFNTKRILENFNQLTPEVKDFLMNYEKQQQMEGLRQIYNSMPARMNTSGTAATAEARNKFLPETALGAATLLTGHGGAAAVIAALGGAFGKQMLREGKDAFNLSLLKFLGSGEQISSTGFRAMFDHINDMIKGESKLNSAVKNIFQKGSETIVNEPSQKEKERLQDKISSLSNDKTPLTDMGKHLVHYMPDNVSRAAMVASRAVDYLNMLAPKKDSGLAFDTEIEPTKEQKNNYYRTLGIAESPLSAFNYIKNGSLLPSDVKTISTIYPSLYQSMKDKIQSQILNSVHDEKTIPYHVRQSLSLFMGQPLEYSVTPQAIQAAQITFIAKNVPPQSPMTSPKKGTAKMSKISDQYRTSEQGAIARQSKV